MVALLCFFLALLASPFRSKSRLEAENAALRHQLAVLQRKIRGRIRLTNIAGFRQSSKDDVTPVSSIDTEAHRGPGENADALGHRH
jgi:hypothetical protein